jgi:hypothetical protein
MIKLNENQKTKIVLIVALVVIILFGFLGIQLASEARREQERFEQLKKVETDLIKMSKQFDTLTASADRVEKLLKPQYDDLKDWNDMYVYLTERHAKFAKIWAVISVAEAGWYWESNYAKHYHNVFGMSNCTFTSKVDCAEYAIKWMNFNPPTYDEVTYNRWEQYFRRRGYNTENPFYYERIKQVLETIDNKSIPID